MKVISKTNNRIIVEHNNFRAMVSPDILSEYEQKNISAEELIEMGIPVSVRWSDFITISLTTKDVERSLHQHGIHTLEDLLKNPKAVSGAILEVVGYTAGTIYKSVKNSQKQQMGGG